VTVNRIDRGMLAHLERLKALEDLEVVAGHMGENAQEPHPKSRGVTKQQVSRFVHFGTPRMPARPYTDLAVQELQSSEQLERAFAAILKSRKTSRPVAVELRVIGRIYATAVRDAIVAVGAVDTGATRDAVRYQVRMVRGGLVLEEGKPGA
jgi:hypothetical protein